MKIHFNNPNFKKQISKIQIDPWDTWSADITLSAIIVPVLQQLKNTQHGAPTVELIDCPKELHPPDSDTINQIGTITDENYFKRWDYVLDEMIFAHTSKSYDWEEDIIPDDWNGYDMPDEWSKIQNRITNGFRLFGKYYESLWD